jgi:hypothetical protein
MNSDQVVRRLLAYEAGRPLPAGATMHFPIVDPDELRLLVFVKMGGESGPWGIGWAGEQGAADIFTVPEPRNRDAVAEMLTRFAPLLLSHLSHPSLTAADADDSPFRQVWLPNGTHVDMLHHLAYTFTFTRFGVPARALALNALGRAANWLFRESQRPGQVTVMDVAAALRESFTFPAEAVRQQHLGFLLAWLETQGSREVRASAARDAERHAIATNLDPDIEREELQPVLEAYNDARRAGAEQVQRREARRIEAVIGRELERRIDLVRRALRVLRGDHRRPNTGLALLIDAARSEHDYHYSRVERRLTGIEEGPVYIVSPETDRHPAAAAVGFFRHEESADLALQALIHDDVELQAQAIAAGDAVRGLITAVNDEGAGRRSTPVWTIRSSDTTPLRIRAGSQLCVAGLPRRSVVVRDVAGDAGDRVFTVEVTNLKLASVDDSGSAIPPASDKCLRHASVLLVPTYGTGISILKRKKVWERGGPGAWLTHAAPPPRRRWADAEEDAVDQMLGDR